MNTKSQENLFKGYLNGSLEKGDERSLIDWINASKENHQSFKKYIKEHQFSQPHSAETIEAWRKLEQKTVSRRNMSRNQKINFPNWLKVAAVFVIALISGFFLNQLYRGEQLKSYAMNEIVVPNGENAKLILSDGTRVYLRAGTNLKYPAVFSENRREVILSGEAFFDVAKDESNPFLIKTPEFDVKVTGTSFNLRTYKEEDWKSLILHTGSVTIINRNQQFVVNPGEKYSFNSETLKYKLAKADLEKSLLRKAGHIFINDLNMEQLGKVLEREFGMSIIIKNESLKKIRYTGQFKPNETLLDVLFLIKDASPAKFSYELNDTKDVITIR